MSSLIDDLTALAVVAPFPLAILFAIYKFRTSGRVRIARPKLGLLNLGDADFTAILNEDRAALGSFFEDVVVSTDGRMRCSVRLR